jgi:hypothetical protein
MKASGIGFNGEASPYAPLRKPGDVLHEPYMQAKRLEITAIGILTHLSTINLLRFEGKKNPPRKEVGWTRMKALALKLKPGIGVQGMSQNHFGRLDKVLLFLGQ